MQIVSLLLLPFVLFTHISIRVAYHKFDMSFPNKAGFYYSNKHSSIISIDIYVLDGFFIIINVLLIKNVNPRHIVPISFHSITWYNIF